jgi:hypothetical protein
MLAVLGISLGACVSASDKKAASIGGACNAFEPATQVVEGKTRVDQRWIDGQIESGVSACGFSRPKPKQQTVARR